MANPLVQLLRLKTLNHFWFFSLFFTQQMCLVRVRSHLTISTVTYWSKPVNSEHHSQVKPVKIQVRSLSPLLKISKSFPPLRPFRSCWITQSSHGSASPEWSKTAVLRCLDPQLSGWLWKVGKLALLSKWSVILGFITWDGITEGPAQMHRCSLGLCFYHICWSAAWPVSHVAEPRDSVWREFSGLQWLPGGVVIHWGPLI